MAAHQAPPSLGFSRQEHWNGLPFPSPMHESEKWKWSHSVTANSLRFSMGFSRQEYWSGVPSPSSLKRSPSLQSWLFSLLWTYFTFLHSLSKFWDLLLSFFHILAVVTDASITIGVLIFLWDLDFNYFV